MAGSGARVRRSFDATEPDRRRSPTAPIPARCLRCTRCPSGPIAGDAAGPPPGTAQTTPPSCASIACTRPDPSTVYTSRPSADTDGLDVHRPEIDVRVTTWTCGPVTSSAVKSLASEDAETAGTYSNPVSGPTAGEHVTGCPNPKKAGSIRATVSASIMSSAHRPGVDGGGAKPAPAPRSNTGRTGAPDSGSSRTSCPSIVTPPTKPSWVTMLDTGPPTAPRSTRSVLHSSRPSRSKHQVWRSSETTNLSDPTKSGTSVHTRRPGRDRSAS